MRVGFDFDGVLGTHRMQRVAGRFISDGHEVWIVTSRTKTPHGGLMWDNNDVFDVAKTLKIADERIVFTEYDDKFRYLDGFSMFFDDDEVEVELIEENVPECTPILVRPTREYLKIDE